MREHGIDRVIVTSPDWTHADHVVAALEAGADVIVEKPLTTSEEGVRRIADAVDRTGRSVTVTFNYRYSPRNSALKEVVASGAIGEVTSVHFEWVLDTSHGADYFRRWHREKEHSGGLLIHKSSHHFDLVNWWLDDAPSRVFASGGLRFYGAENAARRGLGPASRTRIRTTRRCGMRSASICATTTPCGRSTSSRRTTTATCVTATSSTRASRSRTTSRSSSTTSRGASMSYSLNAHAPWEGYTVAVNGTRGRAELTVVERGAVLLGRGGRPIVDPSARPMDVDRESGRPVAERLVVQRHFEPARDVPIPEGVRRPRRRRHRSSCPTCSEACRATRSAAARPGSTASARSRWVSPGNRSLETGQAVSALELDLGRASRALARSVTLAT